jgi:polyhydroxybutyrate depolymerase
MDTNLIQTCNPNQALPMAYFSGTADPEVPYNGGAMNNPTVTPIVAVDTAVQFWVNNNNCQTSEPVVNIPDNVPEDSSTVELFRYTDCDCDADFYFYKVINGGHTWPGVPIPQFPQLGNTNEDIHASYLLWNFFSQFSLCETVTSIDEQVSTSVISVYPNPTNDILYVKTNDEIENITVYDFMGRSVIKESRKEINLTQQPSGVYFLVVEYRDKTTLTMKVIKK